MDDNLVFDIGSNAGDDTAYYLNKGFKVVAVEASPILASTLRERFDEQLKTDRLTIVNAGVFQAEGTFPFYRNLDNDHWSSFDPAYGTRQGTRYETIDVPCVTISSLLNMYGVPRYLKIDVEGADRMILAELCRTSCRPAFISVEEYGFVTLSDLHDLGYEAFFIAPQRDKSWASRENGHEGMAIEKTFNGYDSGPFGLDIPGPWLSFEEARDHFAKGVRNEEGIYVGPEHEWHDVHATKWDRLLCQ
jgi:FkbM family methyltransferase